MVEIDPKRQKMIAAVGLVVLGYVAVAAMFYRFRHPDQTETELFLHLWDAACWR